MRFFHRLNSTRLVFLAAFLFITLVGLSLKRDLIPYYEWERHYDVLINAYMRSGSTLTGISLGWRNDTFYVFEPLYKISVFTYFHGNNTMCRTDRLECKKTDPEIPLNDTNFTCNKEGGSVSLVNALKILRQLYDCQFNNFDRLFDANFTIGNGGPPWYPIRNCIREGKNPTTCMHTFATKGCKKANHMVIKVIRLTTDLLEDLLSSRADLKIIHLFRDPRAIINSRIRTFWYPAMSHKQIVGNAKALCTKMLKDYTDGQRLLMKYPERFKFIYYEDLNDNLHVKVKKIYKYLGMDLSEYHIPREMRIEPTSQSYNISERWTNTAHWWRLSLPWNITQGIDKLCADVYRALGYKTFKNFEEYKNMSFKSFEIPDAYSL